MTTDLLASDLFGRLQFKTTPWSERPRQINPNRIQINFEAIGEEIQKDSTLMEFILKHCGDIQFDTNSRHSRFKKELARITPTIWDALRIPPEGARFLDLMAFLTQLIETGLMARRYNIRANKLKQLKFQIVGITRMENHMLKLDHLCTSVGGAKNANWFVIAQIPYVIEVITKVKLLADSASLDIDNPILRYTSFSVTEKDLKQLESAIVNQTETLTAYLMSNVKTIISYPSQTDVYGNWWTTNPDWVPFEIKEDSGFVQSFPRLMRFSPQFREYSAQYQNKRSPADNAMFNLQFAYEKLQHQRTLAIKADLIMKSLAETKNEFNADIISEIQSYVALAMKTLEEPDARINRQGKVYHTSLMDSTARSCLNVMISCVKAPKSKPMLLHTTKLAEMPSQITKNASSLCIATSRMGRRLTQPEIQYVILHGHDQAVVEFVRRATTIPVPPDTKEVKQTRLGRVVSRPGTINQTPNYPPRNEIQTPYGGDNFQPYPLAPRSASEAVQAQLTPSTISIEGQPEFSYQAQGDSNTSEAKVDVSDSSAKSGYDNDDHPLDTQNSPAVADWVKQVHDEAKSSTSESRQINDSGLNPASKAFIPKDQSGPPSSRGRNSSRTIPIGSKDKDKDKPKRQK
jgi:hypothetical protein